MDRYGYGGRPLLLLHGFPTSSFLWRDVGIRLARRRHVVYAPDLLGFGESDRPFEADFGIAAQAEYMDQLLTALRVAQATVVGVDLGGTIALRLATMHPDRVARLVLVNSGAFDAVPGADVRTFERRTFRFALRVTRTMMGAAPLLAPVLQRSVADAERHMPPRLVARYLAPFVGQEGVAHLYALARSLRSHEVEELPLEEVAAPTLVVRGEADRWLPDEVTERLAAALPAGELLRVPGSGRLLPEERPEYMTALIHAFDAGAPLPASDAAPAAGDAVGDVGGDVADPLDLPVVAQASGEPAGGR